MNIHTNARLTPARREALMLAISSRTLTPLDAAAANGVSERTIRKWLARFRKGGRSALQDRSSRPLHSPRRTPPAQLAVLLALRQKHRMPAFQIAASTGLSKATVCRLLRRHDLHDLRKLEPHAPALRYERSSAGELIHFDIKKLGRFIRPGARMTGNPHHYSAGAGYEFVHVAIDDFSRIAFAQILPDESTESALAFLHAALSYFKNLGITAQRLMSDNGGCYRSTRFAAALACLGIKHVFTRPYTPKTNGKAERFIQTTLREWAYAKAYQSSLIRASFLHPFLHRYNWHRPHHSLNLKPPASRIPLPMNNVLTLHR